MNIELKNKLYYNIGEVSKAFKVNSSLLRFWEKEFKELNPKKKSQSIELYDLASDISESNNLAQENEALTNEIIQKMNSFDEKLKNAQRPAGKL